MKINIGSGKAKIKNWTNIDSNPDNNPDLLLDINEFNFKANSLDFIYSEHFIEHLSLKEAQILLKKCFVALKPFGAIRIATPDLDFLCQKYFIDWQDQDWIKIIKKDISNRCQMMNCVFYDWGHKYIYNEQQLSIVLKESGFKTIDRFFYGQSNEENFIGLETRIDSKLILEARKEFPCKML